MKLQSVPTSVNVFIKPGDKYFLRFFDAWSLQNLRPDLPLLLRCFFFASRAVQCYGSRPSERARHESKLDQTHLLVREILYVRCQAKLAPAQR